MHKHIIIAYKDRRDKFSNHRPALSKNLLSLATNPIPIKAAMAMLNLASDELRLPMMPLEEDNRAALRQTLTEYGLLK
jgi:4-hydroxy-tetrahydrodipicolinate synthase